MGESEGERLVALQRRGKGGREGREREGRGGGDGEREAGGRLSSPAPSPDGGALPTTGGGG